MGPIVPSEITRKLETDSMIISALISELIKEGLVFYSHKKIGSSPLYYVKGQESKMRERLEPELNIAEKKIVEFFEKNKLMLKANLSPQQRYMVDDLRDFVTPLTLNINGEDKIFYKHYSISTQTIYDELKKKKIIKKVKTDKSAPQSRLFDTPRKEFENKQDTKKVVEEKFGENNEKKEEEYTPKVERLKDEVEYEEFDDLSEKFFTQYNLKVLEAESIRKNSEANFIVLTNYRIPQKYFVKYYKKKRISEKDINNAYTQSQLHKMPCIIITIGKLSKKSEESLEKLGSYVNVIKL